MSTIGSLSESLVSGNNITFGRTESGHLTLKNGEKSDIQPSEASFGDLVRKGMNSVNEDQMTSSDLFVKMITEPDSVEAHDVSIAMAKANMSLQMTKSIVDGAVQAYQDIINMR